MNDGKKTALIAGATGVVGRNLVRHLACQDDWEVIAVSRRKPDVTGEFTHLSIDLLDPAACQEVAGSLASVSYTHLTLPTKA